jgi:hypothetical protein
MGAIKIKRVIENKKGSILIKKKRSLQRDSNALVALQLIRGDKKITQRKSIFGALKTNDYQEGSSLSIHLHKLNDTFLGLKRAYMYDEISMDITLPGNQKATTKRRKLVFGKKSI